MTRVSTPAYATGVLARLASGLYLLSLGLLPWAWWPPFPWLHEHAQWSDAVFAAAFFLWAGALLRERRWPRLHPAFLAITCYVGWATVSWFAATTRPPNATAKILGLAELAALSLVTADVASRPSGFPRIVRVIAVTSLAAAAAAGVGSFLLAAGIPTRLVGSSGDLVPGLYPRVQAGFTHPNLLASFAVFAFGVTASDRARCPRWLRRLVAAALGVTLLFTFSRSILSFGVVALLLRARTAGARIRAAGAALATALIFVALTLVNVRVSPLRPLDIAIDPRPSPRQQAAFSTIATITEHPLLGTGPATSPGHADGVPFDAHCTPLNIAGGLGLPALAAFAAIPWLLARARPRLADRALWATLLALSLDSLASDVEDFRHLFVLFGLLAASDPPGDQVG